MAPFIPKPADQTAPLRALTKKDVPFEWNSSLQKVFENVKTSICKDIALTYFDVTKATTIQVDASKIGTGAALLQDGRLIAFASKALTETEQRYANIERKLLVVIFGCERFHTCIYGKPFVVETDHKPLEKSLASTPPCLQPGCCCVYSTMTSASNTVLAKRWYSWIASCTSIPSLTKRFTLNS